MPTARIVRGRGAFLVFESHPELVALTQQRDEDIDLARAALFLARPAYPALAVEPYLAKLDATAASVRERLGDDRDPRHAVAAINRQLFEVEGFRGNERDYNDPRNSYLNEVLDRNGGNRTKTAKDLGVDPRTIFRHLEKLEAERRGEPLLDEEELP